MKTGLVLAGGGSRGAYEMGVWQALREMGIKIDVVCGTSIGSMNAALVAADAFKEARHLWLTLETAEVFDYKHAIENKGIRFTSIKDIMAECVSEEKIRKSDIEFGLVTVELSGMKSHHLWTQDIPEGKLLDYVFASCSCFPVVMPYKIEGKEYIDGGFNDTCPIGMALEKNCERIIAVNLDGNGVYKNKDLKAASGRLTLIKSHWDLGNFAVFNPAHSEDIMRLGYLDTMKAFGVFTGKKFTFMRGQIPARDIKNAELLAELLGLDHKIIYSKSVYEESVVRKAEETKKKLNRFGTLDQIDVIDDKITEKLSKMGIKLPKEIRSFAVDKLNLDSDTKMLLKKILE